MIEKYGVPVNSESLNKKTKNNYYGNPPSEHESQCTKTLLRTTRRKMGATPKLTYI